MRKTHSPPPTRFGSPVTAQARSAVAAAKHAPPPPTRFAPPAAAQPKPGPTMAPARVPAPPATRYGGPATAQAKMAPVKAPPPPPTRYGAAGTAQPKPAPSVGKAPPPTRYGGPATAQPKKVPGQVSASRLPVGPGVIQRMQVEDEIEYDMDYVETPDRADIPTSGYNFAASRSVEMSYFTGKQVSKPGVSDLAATHVAPDAGIKHTLARACNLIASGKDPAEGFRIIDRLITNTKIRNGIILANDDFPVVSKGIGKPRKGKTAHAHAAESDKEIDKAAEALYAEYGTDDPNWAVVDELAQELHNELSTAPGNLPDYGLHRMFNQPVSDRYHLNVSGSGSFTPFSDSAADMGLDGIGIAVSKHGNNIITRQGGFFPVSKLSASATQKLVKVGASRTGIDSPPATD